MDAAWSQNVAQEVPEAISVSRPVDSPLDSIRRPAAINAGHDGPSPGCHRQGEASLAVEDLYEHRHPVRPCASILGGERPELGLVRARVDKSVHTRRGLVREKPRRIDNCEKRTTFDSRFIDAPPGAEEAR